MRIFSTERHRGSEIIAAVFAVESVAFVVVFPSVEGSGFSTFESADEAECVGTGSGCAIVHNVVSGAVFDRGRAIDIAADFCESDPAGSRASFDIGGRPVSGAVFGRGIKSL